MPLPQDSAFLRDDAFKNGMTHDGIDRFFHHHRRPQNPYQSEYANYYQATSPIQPIQTYGIINNGYGLKFGVGGPGIYAGDHTPAAFSPGGYMSQPPYESNYAGGGGMSMPNQHRSKSKNSAMNALTLLAFLFFINVLQNCLKEQMSTLNPTVMVMTGGTSRLRKSEAVETDPSKELNDNNFTDVKLTDGDVDFEELTNDQGDVFYRPTLMISSKLSTSFDGRMFNETIN